MNSISSTKLGLMIVMILTSFLAMEFHPTHRIADDGPAVNLETMIPKQFGNWREAPQQSLQIINPQQKEVLDRIYTQTLSRTYTNGKGDTVMLSIAYGVDQSDAKQLHYPEVCYPAQGFQVVSNQEGVLETNFGRVKVKRLITVLGSRREPLTYWITVGNKVVAGSKEAKIVQLNYGFKGEIPDGLILRASSITSSSEFGFYIQGDFLRTLLGTVSATERMKLIGL